MGENSKIGWTDHTFNPWIGCQKVSEGCANCYAERDWDHRRHVARWGPMGTRIVTSEQNWKQPLRWNRMAQESGKRLKVFCSSLADVFDDWHGQCQHSAGPKLWLMNQNNGHDFSWGAGHVLDDPQSGRALLLSDVRYRLFKLIDTTPNLDWLLVTKRPENVPRMWKPKECKSQLEADSINETGDMYRSNVWLLTSVENQEAADERIPELLKCRDLAPVLGISAEPLLELIDLHSNIPGPCYPGPIDATREFEDDDSLPLDWVIGGGESGPDSGPNARRERDLSAMESLHSQCEQAGVPFFCKQDSGRKEGQQGRIPDHIWNTKQFPNAPGCRW